MLFIYIYINSNYSLLISTIELLELLTHIDIYYWTQLSTTLNYYCYYIMILIVLIW